MRDQGDKTGPDWTGVSGTIRNDAQEAKKQGFCLDLLKDNLP